MSTFYAAICRLLPEETKWEIASDEDNINCLTRIAHGSGEAVDEFILSNMRLVSGVVTKFIARHPKSQYLAEDMFSEGLWTLTKGVKTIAARLQADITWLPRLTEHWGETNNGLNMLGYLYISIYRNVQECYELESSIPISKKIRDRHTPPGKDHPTLKVDIPAEYFELESCEPFNVVHLMEDILGVCETQDDEFIILSTLTMMEREEVAEQLGISVITLWRRKKALYKRFCDEENMDLKPKARKSRESRESSPSD